MNYNIIMWLIIDLDTLLQYYNKYTGYNGTI